jgi:hypothetical protein
MQYVQCRIGLTAQPSTNGNLLEKAVALTVAGDDSAKEIEPL